MQDPTSMSPGSLMPTYPWFLTNDLNTGDLSSKIGALRTLGVPYPAGYEQRALEELRMQAEQIAVELQKGGAPAEPQKEIIALIAYLQRLGTDIKGAPQP
jgi:cytochrome c oxidase cbb3-type subunit I/II